MIVGININSIDYESNNTVKNFFNAWFKNGMFPVITRPTGVIRYSAAVEHILTNAILSENISYGIVKTYTADHFPIFAYIDEEIIFRRKGEENF